jgi:hypothetical protein
MEGVGMKKTFTLFIGLIVGIFLIVGIVSIGYSQQALAESSGLSQLDVGTPTAQISDGNPSSGQAAPPDWGDESIPPESGGGNQSFNTLPTPIPGESLVYFVPSDNDASATVLYLYNTDTINHTVALRGFSYNGVLVYSLNITVPATSFLRLGSDSIAAAPPPSWATPAPIITNFTDFTYFASLSLPNGVKAEGYVLFNPGTGIIDPRSDQGAIPLRFSTDPLNLFLPITQNH